MNFVFVRRGWPLRALLMMLIVYCGGHGIMAWASTSSGWRTLGRLYKSPDGSVGDAIRLRGELKLGAIRFDVDTVSVYRNHEFIYIRGPKAPLLFGSYYFPGLDLPAENLLPADGGKGYWVECDKNEKVYFEMIEQ